MRKVVASRGVSFPLEKFFTANGRYALDAAVSVASPIWSLSGSSIGRCTAHVVVERDPCLVGVGQDF
jgi:hypothetical protein